MGTLLLRHPRGLRLLRPGRGREAGRPPGGPLHPACPHRDSARRGRREGRPHRLLRPARAQCRGLRGAPQDCRTALRGADREELAACSTSGALPPRVQARPGREADGGHCRGGRRLREAPTCRPGAHGPLPFPRGPPALACRLPSHEHLPLLCLRRARRPDLLPQSQGGPGLLCGARPIGKMAEGMNGEEEQKKERGIPSAGAVLPDGVVVEMVYDREKGETAFVRYESGSWTVEPSIDVVAGRLVPMSPKNNLLVHEVVLFPSAPEEDGTDGELLSAVRQFIHRYVDLSPAFEELAASYVLFTWLYDAFEELPYLRVRGDYGSGKSRFLLAVGSLCYKPIFASGTSTVSPIFRILDAFRGTLIVDEADFRLSDEKAEVVKILNNGNARGFPVLRSEATGKKEFDPRAYEVFGPKLVATRGFFEDRALESRCITEDMGQASLRDDIPLNLDDSHKAEALALRNKLLLFRFRNFKKGYRVEAAVNRAIEPRLNQIFAPLLAVTQDPEAKQNLQTLLRRYNKELVAERGMEIEAQLLEVLRDALAGSTDGVVSVKEIAPWFADRDGEDYDRKGTPKWIGSLIRKGLRDE